PDNPCGLAVVNGGLIICDPSNSWNCNLCPNDLPYSNIVRISDDLFFQFQQIDNSNGQNPNGVFSYGWGYNGYPNTFVSGYIRDCCTGNIIEKSPGVNLEVMDVVGNVDFVGVYGTTNYQGVESWTNIQQISINMGNLVPYLQAAGTDCFYIEYIFDQQGSKYSIFTEGFTLEHCQDTVLVEGDFTSIDCFDQYYGDNVVGIGNWSNFQYQYRIKGVLEMQSLSISKEFVGNLQRTVSSQTSESYLLKTDRLPLQIVKMLGNLLSAPIVKVDGYEYIVDGDLTKNNDIGNQWFLEVPLKRINCSKTFGCN
ncbi:MAG: hypothetical protein ACKOPP_06850, partial [Bacteroidota bacterium]